MDDDALTKRELELRVREASLEIRELKRQMEELERQMIEEYTTIVETRLLGGKPLSDAALADFTRALDALKAQ